MNIDNADDDQSPGWDAITHCLERIYPGLEPKHYGTLLSYGLGGPDPLDGISAWRRVEPVPHWHFVTYGFSELYAKESEDPATSGYGFELTFRLAIDADETEPPSWALNFLQNIARYVFKTGNVFEDGHWMTANGPISLARPTLICSMGFVCDPELPAIDTENGRVTFLQVVGLTADEELAAKRWQTRKLLDVFLPHMPLWVTDLGRRSLLDNPAVLAQVEQGTNADGSSSGYFYTDVLAVVVKKRLLLKAVTEITIGARQAGELIRLLPLRLPFERPLLMIGPDWRLEFLPAEQDSIVLGDQALTLHITAATALSLAASLEAKEGVYKSAPLPALQWRVEKTLIKDPQGNVVEVFG